MHLKIKVGLTKAAHSSGLVGERKSGNLTEQRGWGAALLGDVRSASEHEVSLSQRQVFHGLARDMHAVSHHAVRLGVHLDGGQRAVEFHVRLLQAAAAHNGHNALGQAVLLVHARGVACLGHERKGAGGRGETWRAGIHGAHDDGLSCWDGRVGESHLGTRDVAALEDNVWLHPKECGAPQTQVGNLPNLNGSHQVAHAVCDGGVDGVLGDVALHALVVHIAPAARGRILGQLPALHLHFVGRLPRA
mmetsp:Transcript_10046/g.25081  ORF Transcript_10046/g.25081 Transcript_10046/m.25081 type:complete len:247 (+) Transcript_10046:83-823(+)